MASHQRALETKIEVLLKTSDGEAACLSGNLHGRFFGEHFDICLADDRISSSSCVGLGLERLVLALVAVHGDVLAHWPSEVRDRLLRPSA